MRTGKNGSRSVGTLVAALTLIITALSSSSMMAGLETKKPPMRTDTISVPEIQCGMCENRIEKVVGALEGVASVTADAASDRVIVTYDRRKVLRIKIERTIAAAGYDAGNVSADAVAQEKLHACCKPSED